MKSSDPDIRLGGPFLGLCTAAPPELIGRNCASDTLNMTVAEGYLRPRPGTTRTGSWEYSTRAEILSMVHWDVDPGVLERVLILFKTARGQLMADPGQSSLPIELAPAGTLQTDTLACWVPFNRRMYVVDGSDRVLTTDGTPEGTAVAGLEPPRLPNYEEINPTLEASIDSRYLYWFSLYDANRDVESNATPDPVERNYIDSPKRLIIKFRRLNDRHPLERYTHHRVYRQDLAAEDPAAFLILQVPIEETEVIDQRTNDEYIAGRTRVGQEFTSLGSPTFGPYPPSLNGIPPKSRVAAAYKDRMFYGSAEDGSIIYLSAIGHPDHVHPDNYIVVQADENDNIAGLAEWKGQLHILKRTSLWILSGAVVRITNEIAALGGATPQSFENLYRTEAPVGGVQASGNGLVVTDVGPFYAGADGLRHWNGERSMVVTDDIRTTWQAFTAASTPERRSLPAKLTFAYDGRGKRLIVCNGGSLDGSPSLMVYHTGLNAWHPWSLATGWPVTAVANTLGSAVNELAFEFRVCVLAGKSPTRDGYLFYVDDEADGDDAWYVSQDRQPFDFYWVSAKIPLRALNLSRVYSAIWTHAAADDVVVRLGFACDGEDPLTEAKPFENKLLTSRTRRVQRVERRCARLAFVIRSAANETRQRAVAIESVGLCTAPSGRR